MSTTYVEFQNLTTEICCNCGILFAMPQEVKERRRKDRKNFYCPNGHAQHYIGKTREQQLEEELARQKSRSEQLEADAAYQLQRRQAAERQAAAHKGVVTKLKRRASAGVCPCCNRHFENLHRHMTTKHPDFAKAEQ